MPQPRLLRGRVVMALQGNGNLEQEEYMGKMSKRKGAAGEREAAEKLNEVLGTRFHRGRQYHGGPESPVLACDLPGLHIEVGGCLERASRKAGLRNEATRNSGGTRSQKAVAKRRKVGQVRMTGLNNLTTPHNWVMRNS